MSDANDSGFAACLADIPKVAAAEVPSGPDGPDLETIGWWLAARNLALVPVRDPASFQWAGWWIARLGGGDGYVVMAGTPSGVAWTPAGTTAGDGDVVEGWVVAAPALSLPSRDAPRGAVEALYRFAAPGAPGEALASASLVAGVGIEGDRYALGTGHFQGPKRWGQALTLIEAEALDGLAAEHGIRLAPDEARRNVVTRGVDLNALLGRRFRIGDVRCQGQRLAEPCSWLQRTAPPGTLRGLVHRGGLRADILEGGTVRPGDRVVAEDDA